MEKIYYQTLKETLFHEKLENGLEVYLLPKIGFEKTYGLFSTRFGSIDTTFVPLGQKEMIKVEDGIAHFLEHKMFDMENGDAADEFAKLGASSNAFTSSSRTAYLFSTTTNENDCVELLLDFVQSLNITDESVEKEKGIIGQEINMYDDDPGWKLYMNAMDCLYQENPIKVDIAGTMESISKITPEVLYKCYYTFYHPSNMVMVLCGNFEPEKLFLKIKKLLLPKESQGEIKRIYPKKEESIHKPFINVKMEVSTPIFMIGYKDIENMTEDKIKKHIAIEILFNLIMGKSSKLYQKLYEEGLLLSKPDMDYEFSNEYAHILISGTSKNPKKVEEELNRTIKNLKNNGIEEQEFERSKRKLYGDYVTEYNNVGDIARMFLSDAMKGIFSFDYIEKYETVTREYVEEILKNIFKQENKILSIVEPNEAK